MQINPKPVNPSGFSKVQNQSSISTHTCRHMWVFEGIRLLTSSSQNFFFFSFFFLRRK
jgi:hypothetical protein